MTRDDFINLLLAPFGRCRTVIGQWPHGDTVATAIAIIREGGGLDRDHDGTPAGEVENIYFQVRGRRLCLCVEEYGDVSLWGPQDIVAELARAVAGQVEGPDPA